MAEAMVRTIDAGAKDATVYGPTIEECIQRYLDSREDEVATKTLGQFRLVLGNLKEFARRRGQVLGRPAIKVDTTRVIELHKAGNGVIKIATALSSSGQKVSRETVRRILLRIPQVRTD